MLQRQIRETCLCKYLMQVYLYEETNHWYHIPVPMLMQLPTIILQPVVELVGCKSGYCSCGTCILPTDDLVTTLFPLIFRHALHILRTYWGNWQIVPEQQVVFEQVLRRRQSAQGALGKRINPVMNKHEKECMEHFLLNQKSHTKIPRTELLCQC